MAKYYHSKPKTPVLNYGRKGFEGLYVINGELYYRGGGRVLARTLSLTRVKDELQ